MSDSDLQNEEDVAFGLKYCMTCFFPTWSSNTRVTINIWPKGQGNGIPSVNAQVRLKTSYQVEYTCDYD